MKNSLLIICGFLLISSLAQAQGSGKDAEALFAEINAYLKEGKLDELVGPLKQAISLEPTNVSLYITLGSVYDKLFQRELQRRNEAKATEYFEEAKKYYLEATAQDPENFDATYSLGALFYNKAAARTSELSSLSEDFSSAGLKEFERRKKVIRGLFDQALPYFQKAESLDPSDFMTLIALSEIYARKDDETLAAEFRKRLDTVKRGGKNNASYFK